MWSERAERYLVKRGGGKWIGGRHQRGVGLAVRQISLLPQRRPGKLGDDVARLLALSSLGECVRKNRAVKRQSEMLRERTWRNIKKKLRASLPKADASAVTQIPSGLQPTDLELDELEGAVEGTMATVRKRASRENLKRWKEKMAGFRWIRNGWKPEQALIDVAASGQPADLTTDTERVDNAVRDYWNSVGKPTEPADEELVSALASAADERTEEE